MSKRAYLYVYNKNDPTAQLFIYTLNGVMSLTPDLSAAETYETSMPIPKKEMGELAAQLNEQNPDQRWVVGGWYALTQAEIKTEQLITVVVSGRTQYINKFVRAFTKTLLNEPDIDLTTLKIRSMRVDNARESITTTTIEVKNPHLSAR